MLIAACMGGHEAIVRELLLLNCLDVNMKTEVTALHVVWLDCC